MIKIALYVTSILIFSSCAPIPYHTLISLDNNERINSQKEILNGDRNGIWKRGLNEKLISVSPDKAVYFEFVLVTKYGVYPNDLLLFNNKIKVSHNNLPDSIPQFLNGEFVVSNRKSKPILKCFFNDGVLEKKIIYHKNGENSWVINYTLNKTNYIYEEIQERFDKRGVFLARFKITVTKDKYEVK